MVNYSQPVLNALVGGWTIEIPSREAEETDSEIIKSIIMVMQKLENMTASKSQSRKDIASILSALGAVPIVSTRIHLMRHHLFKIESSGSTCLSLRKFGFQNVERLLPKSKSR